MPLDCFRFSPPHSRAILAIVHRRTTSHAAVDPFKPFCGVVDREESPQRAGVLRFLPLAQRRTGNLSNSFLRTPAKLAVFPREPHLPRELPLTYVRTRTAPTRSAEPCSAGRSPRSPAAFSSLLEVLRSFSRFLEKENSHGQNSSPRWNSGRIGILVPNLFSWTHHYRVSRFGAAGLLQDLLHRA